MFEGRRGHQQDGPGGTGEEGGKEWYVCVDYLRKKVKDCSKYNSPDKCLSRKDGTEKPGEVCT